MMYAIDLNCDLGESFGAYHIGMDDAVIPLFLLPTLPAVFMRLIRWLWKKPLLCVRKIRCR